MRDLGNQVVLGTFLSTFVYCLLALVHLFAGKLRFLAGGTYNPLRPAPERGAPRVEPSWTSGGGENADDCSA